MLHLASLVSPSQAAQTSILNALKTLTGLPAFATYNRSIYPCSLFVYYITINCINTAMPRHQKKQAKRDMLPRSRAAYLLFRLTPGTWDYHAFPVFFHNGESAILTVLQFFLLYIKFRDHQPAGHRLELFRHLSDSNA